MVNLTDSKESKLTPIRIHLIIPHTVKKELGVSNRMMSLLIHLCKMARLGPVSPFFHLMNQFPDFRGVTLFLFVDSFKSFQR